MAISSSPTPSVAHSREISEQVGQPLLGTRSVPDVRCRVCPGAELVAVPVRDSEQFADHQDRQGQGQVGAEVGGLCLLGEVGEEPGRQGVDAVAEDSHGARGEMRLEQ